MSLSTPEIKKGYGLVADKLSFLEAYDLAHHRPDITLIKATDTDLFGMGGLQELEDLNAGNFLVICDSQEALGGEPFKNKVIALNRRIIINGITLAAQISERQVREIAKQRDDLFPDLLLVLTAALPEHSEFDFPLDDYTFGCSIERHTRSRFELACEIGNCMVYGAPMDLKIVPEVLRMDVPHMSAGISPDGTTYRDKWRGISTPDYAHELGSRVVLLGTILGEDPEATLNGLGVTRTD